jgi:hypothetical protein
MEPTSQTVADGNRPALGRDIVPTTLEGRAVSKAVRASLAAVRAAQEAARMRRRRDAWRMRAFAAAALLTLIAGILTFHHFRAGRHASAGTGATPAPAASVEPSDPPLPGTTSAAAAEPLSPADDAPNTCDDAVARRRLRTAASACAEAFEAQPTDPALAMKIANVQHARGQYRDAAEWARKAIALHTTDADAFVILAHAETRARHAGAARAAYRHYLAMAPQGWHASEARHALRAPAARQP